MSQDTECIRLIQAFQYVDDRFLDIAEQQKKTRRKKHTKKVLSAIAAGIALFLALPIVAMAYNWFELRDFILPGRTDESTGLTLIEYMYRPETMAVMDWEKFLAGYDMDGSILAKAKQEGFYAEGREDWSLYGVYSYEMGEKLDEIAGKYGLKLHTELHIVSPQEMDYRVGGSFLEESCIKESGYIYENGAFSCDGNVYLNGCQMTSFQMRRTVKGTFDEAAWNIGDIKDYTSWQYVSASGETVLLSLGHVHAFIFADFDKCCITISVLSGRNEGMTKEDLQTLADKVDFRILKEVQD